MRLLFCGDIVGRSGRDVVVEHVPRLRRELGLDFVIVNGENAAAGFGITEKICNEFYAAGIDVISTGNHVWDQRETVSASSIAICACCVPATSRPARPAAAPASIRPPAAARSSSST